MATEMDNKLTRSSFVRDLQLNRIPSSYKVAFKTVKLLEEAIQAAEVNSPCELMTFVAEYGKILIEEQRSETIVGNMTRRILKAVRDEWKLLASVEDNKISTEEEVKEFKESIVAVIGEILEELDLGGHSLTVHALQHIHVDEIILTAGKSNSVENFLKEAAKIREFHVIIAEGAPKCQGQELALRLSKCKNMTVTLIPDCAIYATMSRVNKVIIGTHAVMADGGIKAFTGVHMIALAAKHHNVPLIVLAGQYKLSPQYYKEENNKFGDPSEIMSYSEAMSVGGAARPAATAAASPSPTDTDLSSHTPTGAGAPTETSTDGAVTDSAAAAMVSSTAHSPVVTMAGHNDLLLSVYNPLYDYVPPSLVTLFISNIGGYSPSYVYRLLTELYDTEDFKLGLPES